MTVPVGFPARGSVSCLVGCVATFVRACWVSVLVAVSWFVLLDVCFVGSLFCFWCIVCACGENKGERQRERGRETERKRERDSEKEGKRHRERETGRETCTHKHTICVRALARAHAHAHMAVPMHKSSIS